MKNLIRTLVIVAGGIWFAGCQQGRDAYAVTTTDTLIRFDTAKPNNISAEMPITGLAAGETLRQIDFRPADKVLYGITSANRLVTVNTTTGAVTYVPATGSALSYQGFATAPDFCSGDATVTRSST